MHDLRVAPPENSAYHCIEESPRDSKTQSGGTRDSSPLCQYEQVGECCIQSRDTVESDPSTSYSVRMMSGGQADPQTGHVPGRDTVSDSRGRGARSVERVTTVQAPSEQSRCMIKTLREYAKS